VGIAAAEPGEGQAGQPEGAAANHHYGTVIIVHRRPHVVFPNPHGSHPGGTPDRVIGPDPAVGCGVPPAPIMGRNIREGIFIYPHVAIGGHVVPIAIAVGDVIDHDRRAPIGLMVDVDPLAVAGQIIYAYGAILYNDLLGRGLSPLGQQAGPVIAPSVEGIGLSLVERGRIRGQVSRIHPDAGAFHGCHLAALVTVDHGTAPTNGNRQCPLFVDVQSHH